MPSKKKSKQLDLSKKIGFTWAPFTFSCHPESKARAVFRAKKILSQVVFDMSALEGNPFTFPEVQTLLEGITVGGRKLSDQDEVLNIAQSWKMLFEFIEKNEFFLSKKIFLKLHSQVSKGQALSWGEIRDGKVGISGTEYKPPLPQQLEGIFKKGISEIRKISNIHERSFAFFLFGSLQQFFWDGNKRTSRLMMNGELMKNGYDAISIPANRKQEFNEKMIRFYNSLDATEMMQFLVSCML